MKRSLSAGMLCIFGCAHIEPSSASVDHRSPIRVEVRVASTPQANAGASPCELGTVYFARGSALIDERGRETILAAITCFVHRGMPAHLALTGAADPRGTEEYNLALGERRADAVRKMLVLLGIAPARISVTSTGEESASGRDEDGWRIDRHVLATGL